MGGNNSKRTQRVMSATNKLEDTFIVEVVSARNVPKADVMSESDPFVKLWCVDAHGKVIGNKFSSLYVQDSANPTWRMLRDMGIKPSEANKLHVELYDYDLASKNDLLGRADIPVDKITDAPEEFQMECARKEDLKLPPIFVTLRRELGENTLIKTVFLIRHGESKWNKAQEEKKLSEMVAFDHGLTENGVKQAQQLNARMHDAFKKMADAKGEEKDDPLNQDYVFAMKHAAVAFSSPLTRAVETAVVGLNGHPALLSRGLALLRTAREIKGLGGLDTVGKATGHDIAKRVREELAEVLPGGEEEAQKIMPKIDPYDTQTPWWTKANDKDTKKEMAARFEDFVCTLRYKPSNAVVLVGHSIFIRELCKKYVPAKGQLEQTQPQLAGDMRKKKLCNAGCLAVRFDFSSVEPQIIDAKLLFESQFLEH